MAENKSIIPDVEAVGRPSFLANREWLDADFHPYIVDTTEAYTPPVYTFSYNGATFAPLGGIHALTGQSGNGKTMTLTMLAAAALKGEYMGIRCELPEDKPRRVLFIDTEMEKGNTQLVVMRISAMVGWDFGTRHEELTMISLREVTNALDRWRYILAAIYEIQPTVVFIDGLLDVIEDFNDNAECQQTIYECMAVASHYGISLWCLVHENPGSTKMVGHLGSMLTRKVTDVLSTVKTKDNGNVTFKITQKKARGEDMDDIEFHVISGPAHIGIPVIQQYVSHEEQKTVDGTELYKQILRETITSQYGITTRELQSALRSKLGIGSTKAFELIRTLEEQGLIFRDKSKKCFIGSECVTRDAFDTITREENDMPF